MVRKRIESLVRSLRGTGYNSVYLDRLGSRISSEAAHDELRAEIVRETAAALTRSAEKVDLALLRLEFAADAVQEASRPRERRQAVERYNLLRDRALAARHDLLIHREAAGIRHNHDLERDYPVPPRLSRSGRTL